jgi:carbamoyl-phosphate synthase small subunit
VTQVNVNDGTAEGLANDDLGVLTRQYHPEAHPGPNDSLDFFEDVLDLVETDTTVATSD